MASEEVLDNPTGWVNRHIRQYVETDGKKGHKWNGKLVLLLTTRGRRSGKLRRTALIYGLDHERYVLVASNGGAASNPSWYLNLVADPTVYVQVGAETFEGRARPATARERSRLWELMAGILPQYDGYEKKTEREIPVIVVERV